MRKEAIKFVKMTAGGNDFIILDHSGHESSPLPGEPALKKLCARKTGVGADGVIIIGRSERADFSLRFFNPDGKEHDFCGNGTRCAARLARERNIAGAGQKIETAAGIIEAEIGKEAVSLSMARPSSFKEIEGIAVGGYPRAAAFLTAGVPHLVVVVDDPDNVDMEKEGPELRNHPRFRPGVTNVDFISLLSEKRIKIRTFERGVEGETLSCGSGCVASACVLHQKKAVRQPVECLTHSGALLLVGFPEEEKDKVYLTGDATLVYRGSLEPRFL